MKTIILATISIVLSACFYKGTSQSKAAEVNGIIIETLFPDFEFDTLKNEWAVVNYNNRYTKIYYYKRQTLIQTNYGCAAISSPKHDEYIKPNYKSCYYTYIFSDSSENGIYFDSTNIQSYQILKKDSMVAKEWAFNGNERKVIEDNELTLLTSSTNRDGDLEEYYSLVHKKDSSIEGTMLLVFSKRAHNRFNYSLSEEIERKKGMKLIKIITVTNARYLESSKTNIGRVEIPTQVRKIEITNPDTLIEMFDHAKQIMQ